MKGLLLPLLAALALPLTSIEVKSSSNLPTQCKAVENPIPINKLSDVKGKTEYLLTQPSKKAEKYINQKWYQLSGEISYEGIDYSTRVYVHCLSPNKKYAFVRVTEPSHVNHRKGWVRAKVLTASLTSETSDFNKDEYVVILDTRDTYLSKKVELVINKAPSCGLGTVRGVRGKGTLKVFNPNKTMQVEIFPCLDNIQVKLPDGRALHLRKSI